MCLFAQKKHASNFFYRGLLQTTDYYFFKVHDLKMSCFLNRMIEIPMKKKKIVVLWIGLFAQ